MKTQNGSIASNNFDFLRVAAALLVLISHSYALYGQGNNEPWQKILGQPGSALGVAIFFVMSGFLITHSSLRQRNFFRYMGHRCLRILPALFFSCVFCVFVIGTLATTLPLSEYFLQYRTWRFFHSLMIFGIQYRLPGVFANLPYPQIVNGSLWTLPLEVAMYLLVPLAVLIGLFSRKTMLILPLIFLLMSHIISPENFTKLFLPGLQAYYFFSLGFYFFAGAMIYIYFDKIPFKNNIALFLVLAILILAKTSLQSWILQLALPYLIIFLAFAPWLKLNRFGKYGDFSYGIYVFAFPIQQLLIAWYWPKLNFFMFLGLALIATFMMAVISWYAVEKPGLKLKGKWKRKTVGYQITANV